MATRGTETIRHRARLTNPGQATIQSNQFTLPVVGTQVSQTQLAIAGVLLLLLLVGPSLIGGGGGRQGRGFEIRDVGA